MTQAYIPRSFRSATAMEGESDVRDDMIYSALVICHGGSSQQKMFTVPQGQTIPKMAGVGIAPTEAHHLIASELTTNQDKAGELGSSLGDAAVRSISLVLEQALPKADGTFGTYGATPHEAAEFLAKTFFQFKVGGKVMIQGPVGQFPSSAGLSGGQSISTTVTDTTKVTGFAQNGASLLGGRRIKVPIQIARNDVVVGVLGLPNGAAYAFSVASGVGQATLVTCVLGAMVRGDVR
ncbi:MAG: hypothetical protein KJ648_07260 [Candidatus Omnitrophica bacterium]|nr:hypothetical protein [Candidatus Omnitrophota bacterium]